MDLPTRFPDRRGLAVTAPTAHLVALYDDAVDAFVDGRPCRFLLAHLVAIAPTFALALACHALVERCPPPAGWPPARAGLSRRERQHLDVVEAVVSGDPPRADGLAAEHLAEFPQDRVIAAVRRQLDQPGEGRPGACGRRPPCPGPHPGRTGGEPR